MSEESWGFAPPPFQPEAALQKLRRELREAGLSEREGRFERRGLAIAQVAVDGAALAAARVTKPSRNSPQWQSRTLRNAADVRDFITDLKKNLAAWSDSDD